MLYFYTAQMKRIILIAAVLLMASTATHAAVEMKYGSLNIFTQISSATIYVDGENRGIGAVQIKQIQAGTHFIKITTLNASFEVILYADVVEVKDGELTTLYIDEHGKSDTNQPAKTPEEVDVLKLKKIMDYSREMHTGWYFKLGYLSNLYYSNTAPNLDNYASTFDLGLGFKLPLAPGIDFSLEMERAQMSSSKNTWYFMPITANIQLSFMPSPYFRGKQYYGLGIGYYMTDLQSTDPETSKQNLTALGYHLFYGIEMPASDESAYFFEFGYHSADISRYNYTMNSSYASVGYRWDVFK